ncbi:chymotrypsin-2-like protein [Leptotrombidium deliense]|uniref:Chymotrypsin-2-like protein n=1 Tax=Leptotrombidium deliense TaxID=299467 RepID=A0A443S343_9ACAR|nr:chymotrypsin-2-like protein [Leptotrombidium deliense]
MQTKNLFKSLPSTQQQCGVQNGKRSGKGGTNFTPVQNDTVDHDPIDDDTQNPYITGGRYARPGELPFQVFLRAPMGNGGSMTCGGSVITNRCVVTAGHCVFICGQGQVQRVPYVEVTFGDYDLRMSDGEYGMTSSDIRPHQSYRPCTSTFKNDIALICFQSEIPMRMTPNGYGSIGTICPPESDSFTTATTSGWGQTTQGFQGPPSPILKVAEVNYLDVETCRYQLWLNGGGLDWNIDPNLQICVSQGNGGRDGACHGDSGGPLFLTDTGRAVLIGIVSYGPQNCPANNPAVYTRVSAYRTWINQMMG